MGQFAAAPTADKFGLAGAVRGALDTVTTNCVVAFGPDLWRRLGEPLEAHRPLLARTGVTGHSMPASPDDLFVWLHGETPDAVMTDVLKLREAMRESFDLRDETAGFVYLDSRDLSGFEDGTANLSLDEAPEVALVADGQPGAGGAYVLTQKWRHDLDGFAGLSEPEQEAVIGRTKADSVELENLPVGSHVARVVIEEDGEELEIWRRSVPWGGYDTHGLFFLAFSADPDRFERMLDRMFAVKAGPHDRLVEFSTPVSGARYFAPSAQALHEAIR